MQSQQPDNQRNLLMAIVLSMAVLLVWQMFYAGPKMKEEQARRDRAAQEQAANMPPVSGLPGQPAVPGQPGVAQPSIGGILAGAVMTREQALRLSPRLAIATDKLTGSISLKGGRIDDLVLVGYREAVNPNSPNVALLNPLEAPGAYFTEYGWLNAPGANVAVPDSNTEWAAEGNQTLTPTSPVTIRWDNGAGITFKRTFAVDENYLFTMTETVENRTGTDIALAPYARIYRFGVPKIEGFFIQHEGLIGYPGEEGLKEYTYANAQEDNFAKSFTNQTGGWLGITDKYWATALIPPQSQAYSAGFDGRPAQGTRKELFLVDYTLPLMSIPSGELPTRMQSHLFAGAKQPHIVNGYAEALKVENLQYLIDWGWFYFITKPLYYMIEWLYNLLGNFGLAILATTLIVKALFFPLANKAYESMAKMKMLQPEMEKLRERYKDDKAKMQQELMQLYSKKKINPLAGCLPILLQIPVFFALYKVLFISIDMRHAPFFGWIQDLSAPDPTSLFNLFGLLPYAVPDFLTIGVWPLIMGVTMWLQMQLNPKQPDPTQQMIFNWMPVLFTFMLGGFASGLVIYWAWNNVLSLAQQYFIMKRQGADIPLIDNIRQTFGALVGLAKKRKTDSQ